MYAEGVLLIEFRSFYEPVVIVFGAVRALFGTVVALRLTLLRKKPALAKADAT